jgi:hypothetical protein
MYLAYWLSSHDKWLAQNYSDALLGGNQVRTEGNISVSLKIKFIFPSNDLFALDSRRPYKCWAKPFDAINITNSSK